MLNINLYPEYILSVYGFYLSNTFFTSVIVTLLLSALALKYYINRDSRGGTIVKGIRILVYELYKLTNSVTRDKNLTKKILPLISTFFLFIAAANLLALIPGFLGSFFIKTADGNIPVLRSPNSDLTTTLALAMISVVGIQFFSIRELGLRNYIARFLNFSSPIKFILGFFELISEGIKLFSFSFRLFGNIFAGEVLLLVVAFLLPYITPLPFMILEVFVGIVQAFIFMVLTLTFIKTSIASEKISTKTKN